MDQHRDVGVGREAPARGVPDVAPLGKEFSQVAEHLDSLVDGGVKSQHGSVLLREDVVQRYVGLDSRRAVVELDDRHLRRCDRLIGGGKIRQYLVTFILGISEKINTAACATINFKIVTNFVRIKNVPGCCGCRSCV